MIDKADACILKSILSCSVKVIDLDNYADMDCFDDAIEDYDTIYCDESNNLFQVIGDEIMIIT